LFETDFLSGHFVLRELQAAEKTQETGGMAIGTAFELSW
jgi:hypothetical protein